MREELQSVKHILGEKQNILIACPSLDAAHGQPAGADGLSSALALYQYLNRIGKSADIVMSNFTPRPEFSFLPNINLVQNQIKQTKPFIISLPIDNKKISDFSYEIVDRELKIFITPSSGKIESEKIKFEHLPSTYDLIITIDAPSLGALGEVYDNNRDLFQALPIINIDHSPKNNRYGHINLVDISVASTAEIIFQILKLLETETISAATATCVLAGLIAKTNSFKSPHIRTQTIDLASQLIACGAEREKIVTHFYRNKEIKTLKLWGRILARLKFDETTGLLWSLVLAEDFIVTGAEQRDAVPVIHELLYTHPHAQEIVIFFEKTREQIDVLITTNTNANLSELVAPYLGVGSGHSITVSIQNKNLMTAEAEFIAHLKQKLTPP